MAVFESSEVVSEPVLTWFVGHRMGLCCQVDKDPSVVIEGTCKTYEKT